LAQALSARTHCQRTCFWPALAVSDMFSLCLALVVLEHGSGAFRQSTCTLEGGDPTCEAGAEQAVPLGFSYEEVIPKANLITQEVDELRGLIALCEERIGLLQDLRSTLEAGVVSLPKQFAQALQEDLPLVSELTQQPERVPTGSADDFLVSKRIVVQEIPASFVKFLPLRSPYTASPSTALAMPSALVVSARTDGVVNLFTPSGEFVQTFSAGHELPITHLAVSPSHDEYLVATGDPGEIRVHKVNVRQKRVTREKERTHSSYLGPQVNVTTQFSKSMQVPGELTALSVVSQKGTKYFVAGDAEGKVSIFTRNGTFRARMDATIAPGGIQSFDTHPSNLLFRAGSEWGFINVENLEVTHIDCPMAVTAAIFDSRSSRVLVADEDGTVFALTFREKRHCKVEHRFPRGATQAPVELASIRGFTLGLEMMQGERSMSLFALNMTSVGKESDRPVAWRISRPVSRDWAVYKRYQQGDLLAFLSKDGHEIEIVELLMQVYTAPAGDSFGSFKLPVMAVAIVLVIGYQYMKQ